MQSPIQPYSSPERSVRAPKSRGGCLTTYLMIFSVVSVNDIIDLIRLIRVAPTTPGIMLSFFFAFILAGLSVVALYGLWTWKKWGVRCQVAAFLLSFLNDLFYRATIHTTVFNLSIPLTVVFYLFTTSFALLLFFFAIRGKWQYFS